jgi:hypothetical protein
LSFFPGRRLGGGGGGAESYPRRQAQAPATRSWGYGPPQDHPFPPSPLDDTPSDYTEYSSNTTHVVDDDDPELAEAIRRSHASYRAEAAGSDRYTPSAPPYYPEEDEEGEGVMYPDLVGERPPLYPANPGPPPLRGGWRLPTPQPRFDLPTILYWVIGSSLNKNFLNSFSVADPDPGSDAFLPLNPGSGILFSRTRISDPGSQIHILRA